MPTTTANRPTTEELVRLSREFRVEIIRMLAEAGSGHPGGSLSAIDFLTVLYFGGTFRN
ncbi:MAG: transketolase, partial [Elusimicrobia bacterium]|nr:transketolase [Elusimicrobiota bacterium]